MILIMDMEESLNKYTNYLPSLSKCIRIMMMLEAVIFLSQEILLGPFKEKMGHSMQNAKYIIGA